VVGLLQTLPLTVDASLASALTAAGLTVTPDTPVYPVLRLALKDVAQILPYLLMVLILILRPKGLLGTRED
ncbi:MAG: branched-chain amino acid ABC transporter permease, partial [Roseateles sp.]